MQGFLSFLVESEQETQTHELEHPNKGKYTLHKKGDYHHAKNKYGEVTHTFYKMDPEHIVGFQDLDNSRYISKSYTISASGVWEYKTITIPADTTGAFDNDNALSFEVIFWLGTGSDLTSGTLNSSSWNSVTAANRAVGQTNLASATNNYWQITGVQLEVGATATPFEFLPAHLELAACKRYYHKSTGNEGFGTPGTTTQATMKLPLPVTMRATPTVTFGGTIGTTDPLVATKTGSSVVAWNSTVNEVGFYMGGFSGFTIGVFTYWNGSPIECSAEL